MLQNIQNEHKIEIESILKALKWGSYDNLNIDNFENKIVIPFEEHLNINAKYDWDAGLTKGVLIFKEMGFVIKIPFKYLEGEPLCGAEKGISNWDYCSQEANISIVAKEYLLQDIFLEVICIDKINNYPIYIQEFAELLRENNKSSTKENEKQVNEIIRKNNYDLIDFDWEANICAFYGEDYYKVFKNFIYINEIEDLHSKNIGYIGERPVILDYAGFND